MDSSLIRAALELMEASRVLFKEEGLEIVKVTAKNTYSLHARYSNRMEVEFGLSNMEVALDDLRMILTRFRAYGRLLATVNLRVRRNIPVTFHQPPVAKPINLEEGG